MRMRDGCLTQETTLFLRLFCRKLWNQFPSSNEREYDARGEWWICFGQPHPGVAVKLLDIRIMPLSARNSVKCLV